MNRPIPLIFGPTASGKSGLAMQLAEKLDGEIVNADSRQIYKHMPIITACPTAEDYARVRHHLYEFLEPDQTYSAGAYAADATSIIADILARGKTPVIVGGTGLYVRALIEGLSPIPAIPEELETRIRAEVAADRAGAYARLQAVDAPWAARIQATDSQRIARGLAVFEGTGRTLTDWQQVKGEGSGYDFHKISLCPPREVLHQRIEARWTQMVDMGVVEEIRRLKDMGFTPALSSMKGLGIPEIFAYLEGTMTLEEALALGLIAHRQYAKRQELWLRRQFGGEVVMDIPDVEGVMRGLAL